MNELRQQQALANLIGEINVASESTLGSQYNFRNVAGRTSGFYNNMLKGDLPEHLRFPGEKGGKWKMKGGASCEDSYAIRLAVDSAILLAGAASLIGVGYGGYQTLLFFMTTYGLKDTTIAIITSLYDTLASAGTNLWKVGSSALSMSGTTISSGLNITGDIFIALKNAIPSITITLAKLAPGVAIGRYTRTAETAHADALAAIAGLQATYTTLTEYTGAVTRSITAKKDALGAQITAAKARLDNAVTNMSASTTATVNQTTDAYAAIRTKICGLIREFDMMPGRPINEIMGVLNQRLSTMDISGGKRRMKSRKMKSRKMKSKKMISRKMKSRKNRSRKHYKK